MASPTSRLLELLELLQTRSLTTGREIADRLGIDARTARRYVGVLQGRGTPVEGRRGVGGGYRIRPGYRLPPLMLGDEEAVAVVLGLLATRGTGGEGSADVVDRALEKINRVLPATLRRQVEALQETLEFTRTRGSAPADAAAALLLADAIRRRRRIHAAYRTFAGEESERDLSPFGLVVHSGRWYLAAHARRGDRRPCGHAAADARRLARLDGERAGRPRLRLHDPPARRVAVERARARDPAGGVGLAANGVDRLAQLAADGRRGEREHDEWAPAHPGDADVVRQHPPQGRPRHPLQRHPARVQPLRRRPTRAVRRGDQLRVDPVSLDHVVGDREPPGPGVDTDRRDDRVPPGRDAYRRRPGLAVGRTRDDDVVPRAPGAEAAVLPGDDHAAAALDLGGDQRRCPQRSRVADAELRDHDRLVERHAAVAGRHRDHPGPP